MPLPMVTGFFEIAQNFPHRRVKKTKKTQKKTKKSRNQTTKEDTGGQTTQSVFFGENVAGRRPATLSPKNRPPISPASTTRRALALTWKLRAPYAPQHPSPGTRSAMMAKGVEDRFAQRGGEEDETAQQHFEKVGFDVGEEVGRVGRKNHASHGPALGARSCCAKCSIRETASLATCLTSPGS